MNTDEFQGRALQYAVLETFVKMRDKMPSLHAYTHIRAERVGKALRWSLLQADDHTIHKQQSTNFGDAANSAMMRIFDPYTAGYPKYGVARITIAFYPEPSMSIDVLDEHNTPLFSARLLEVANG
jgi:hypothetical protein